MEGLVTSVMEHVAERMKDGETPASIFDDLSDYEKLLFQEEWKASWSAIMEGFRIAWSDLSHWWAETCEALHDLRLP